ncbi:MAG: glycosyltransferase family 4 protein [FCB group bacterium]|nr:glycosyltransferase family 4 protein [FCB group bacterium]
MSKKRVFLICYYFPPLGGAGVGRPLTLYKYLPQFGYECEVLTVKAVAYRYYEPELLAGLDDSHIYRSGSHDPQRLMYLFGMRKVKDTVIARGKKISDRFFPDPKIGWVKSAQKLGRILCENKNYHGIISTSPPISSHLVAMKLSHEFKLPWVADFRDFWTSYKAEDWFEEPRKIKKAQKLLQEITERATKVTVVNRAIKEYLKRGIVIPNSYDEDRVKKWLCPTDTNNFVIGILGTIDHLTPVEPLFKLLALFREKYPDLYLMIKLIQVGNITLKDFDSLLKKYKLSDKVQIYGRKNREETIHILSDTHLLYMGLSMQYGVGAGRIYDMLASGRPLLAFVPSHGVVNDLIEESNNGFRFDEAIFDGACQYLYRQLVKFKEKKLTINPLPSYADKYSSSNMVQQFIAVLDNLKQ